MCFIVCHPVSPREEKREAEKQESQEKVRKSTGLKGRKRAAHTNGKPQGKKTAGTPRNRQGENRIMQSCERAVFSPRFLCRSIRQEEDFVWGMC
ncbi:MAG: hypothetical protein ACLUER_07515 [Odoribacter splanchnicus]